MRSEDGKDIVGAISVVCISLPSNFREFIKWVAEVRRHEDDDLGLSQEEMRRLMLKVCSYNLTFTPSQFILLYY